MLLRSDPRSMTGVALTTATTLRLLRSLAKWRAPALWLMVTRGANLRHSLRRQGLLPRPFEELPNVMPLHPLLKHGPRATNRFPASAQLPTHAAAGQIVDAGARGFQQVA